MGIWEKLREFSKKSRIIKEFAPFDVRKSRGCPPRLCVNTYVGCPHACGYCYSQYIREFHNPRTKKGFMRGLEWDLELIEKYELGKLVVSISNSTEPLQEPLESVHGHTLGALRLLSERGLKLVILTKNPAKLLESEYLAVLNPANTAIEISCAFLRPRPELEPKAPLPKDRIAAARGLLEAGFSNLAVRVDPIIPQIPDSDCGQAPEEIMGLIQALSQAGVKHVISKVLRAAGVIKRSSPQLYESLSRHYRSHGGVWKARAWQLPEDQRERLLLPVYRACEENGITLSVCYEAASFAGAFKCDLVEKKLGVCAK